MFCVLTTFERHSAKEYRVVRYKFLGIVFVKIQKEV